MDDDRLAQIEAREHLATEGPWVVVSESAHHDDGTDYPLTAYIHTSADSLSVALICDVATDPDDDPVSVLADAEFIAHAREDVLWLLAEVRRLTIERDTLRRSLDNADAVHQQTMRDWANDHAEVARLTEQRDAVLSIHRKRSQFGDDFCDHCGHDWPCDTVRALGVTA